MKSLYRLSVFYFLYTFLHVTIYNYKNCPLSTDTDPSCLGLTRFNVLILLFIITTPLSNFKINLGTGILLKTIAN